MKPELKGFWERKKSAKKPVKKEAPVETAPAAEPEPVKRTAKKEEAPAPKKDLASVLADWDDE